MTSYVTSADGTRIAFDRAVRAGRVPGPEAADGIAIIGADPESEGNYFDSRGVACVYKMSVENGLRKLWREEPGKT